MIITEYYNGKRTDHFDRKLGADAILGLIANAKTEVLFAFHNWCLFIVDDASGNQFSIQNKGPEFTALWETLAKLCVNADAEQLDEHTFVVQAANLIADLTNTAVRECEFDRTEEGVDITFLSMAVDADWDESDVPTLPNAPSASPIPAHPIIAISATQSQHAA